MAKISISVGDQRIAFDTTTGAAERLAPPKTETIDVGGRTLTVGAVYASSERAGIKLPAGYCWSSMRFGLDPSGGVNLKLEKDASASPASRLPAGETKVLVAGSAERWVNDTASYWHDGKVLQVRRMDHDNPPPAFGMTVEVNGVARALCPSVNKGHVPHGPAEGTPYYVSAASTPIRPGDRVTVTDTGRNVSATVILV